jgi:hypothetical protein
MYYASVLQGGFSDCSRSAYTAHAPLVDTVLAAVLLMKIYIAARVRSIGVTWAGSIPNEGGVGNKCHHLLHLD